VLLAGSLPSDPALNQLGVSRICSLGAMQAPPFSWCHDGRGVLLALARLSGADL